MESVIEPILEEELQEIRDSGEYKDERLIESPQGAEIEIEQGTVINFCANNYLGLASDEEIVEAAKEGLEDYGFGLSSVRFICGTQTIHKELEEKVAKFFRYDDAILYSSCWDANEGLFAAILNEEDVIISDELNHASIIDGIRLCSADREIYSHSNMDELEEILKRTQDHRVRVIATDGVFSMDGDYAKLDKICELADKYEALVVVDDSHATGFVGKSGRGTPERFGVDDRVDVITSTFGKALGGAAGGFATGRQVIVDILRQKSRPYLFSNTLPPTIVTAGIAAIDLIRETEELREQLRQNTLQFRNSMKEAGFEIKAGDHPIVPIMLGEAQLAKDMSDELLEEGIYVIGFSYPVVPRGEARIRVQLSAAHTEDQIDRAVDAFEKVGKRHGVV